MEVEVYLEGTDKPITFCKENYNGRNAIDYYLKDIDLDKIERVIAKENFIYTKDELDRLRKNIVDISNCTETSISIEDVTEFSYKLVIEGKLLDVFSMFYNLGMHTVSKVSVYIANDYNLLDTLINKVKMKGDYNKSLIIRFLSEKNGNSSHEYIYRILHDEISKVDIKKMLPNMFTKIYGIKYTDYKPDISVDKLSLNNINNDNLKSIDAELKEILQ